MIRPASFEILSTPRRRASRRLHPFAGLLIGLAISGCEPPQLQPPPAAKIPVTSEVLELETFEPRLTLLGRVEPSSRLELTTRGAGVLRYGRRFPAGLRTGEAVEAGEVLFEIVDPRVQLALAEAELAAEGARAELERARHGVTGGFLPEVEVKRREIDMGLAEQRLAGARHQVERLVHRAEASGVLVIDRSLAPGSEIVAGTVLGQLAVAGPARLEAWASAEDLTVVEPGLEVLCRLPGDLEPVGRGVIREVARQVDTTGTARVVAEIVEDLALPMSGQGVEIEVLLPPRAEALTLPLEAIVMEGIAHRAFVLQPSGGGFKATARQLQITRFRGGRDGERVEVLDGLAAGDRVAVRGAELLSDGQLAVEAATQSADRGRF